jgi:1,4-alpha-glucan branching enzyme
MTEKKTIHVSLNAPAARSVRVAGTFNGWNPESTPLRKSLSGIWTAKVSAPPGRHEYRFVVDGRWLSDPNAQESAPNPFGGDNSVVRI